MSDSIEPTRSVGQTIGLGFAGKCPRCGEGAIFASYLKVADRCTVCGLGFSGHDSGDGAVVPALLVLGAVIVGVALYVEFNFEPPVWVHMAIWGPLTVLSTMGMLPRLKGIGIALQHRFRSTEEETPLGGT
ncbi:MAG: DUF983 domain-containing protein [Proteobacteria bacterium]|nr:DUF983 domain-containing protein [Pseudomonadota bacterium]